MPLREINKGRNDECREGKIKFVKHPQLGSRPIFSCEANPNERIKCAWNRGGKMATSTSRNLPMEEQMKLMDETLEILK